MHFFFVYNKILESAKGEIDAFNKAENDLIKLEQALHDEEAVCLLFLESSLSNASLHLI